MNIKQKIKQIVATVTYDGEAVDTQRNKLIALAYYIGREEGVKRICDKHAAKIAAMRVKARSCRYHNMSHAVIDAGGQDIIYDADYAGDMTATFGDDAVL